ncbi:MAG: biopolymer transporter ExbD [Prevotella sp.]|nr:biopolymer transporter ExbD [Prevotella sp.]
MLFKRSSRETPGLDTTSTADISFMLLIFFLVTSSMDSQLGLHRHLPPAADNAAQELLVSRSDVLSVEMAADGALTADGAPIDLRQLPSRIETIVRQRGDSHLLSLTVDSAAPYHDYYSLQETIVGTYRRLGVRPRISEQPVIGLTGVHGADDVSSN